MPRDRRFENNIPTRVAEPVRVSGALANLVSSVTGESAPIEVNPALRTQRAETNRAERRASGDIGRIDLDYYRSITTPATSSWYSRPPPTLAAFRELYESYLHRQALETERRGWNTAGTTIPSGTTISSVIINEVQDSLFSRRLVINRPPRDWVQLTLDLSFSNEQWESMTLDERATYHRQRATVYEAARENTLTPHVLD